MSYALKAISALSQSGYFGSARLVEASADGRRAKISLSSIPDHPEVWARVCLPNPHSLSAADEVLTAGEDLDDLFVIGVLGASEVERADSPDRLDFDDGACATVGEEDGHRTLRVFSKRGELVLEYDPVLERTQLTAQAGELTIRSNSGDLDLEAAGKLRMRAESVEINARTRVRLGVDDAFRKLRSAISIGPRRLTVSSSQLGFTAQQSDYQVSETRYSGDSVEARLGTGRLFADRLETSARTILQRAKNIYNTVEELMQLRVGRARTLVKGSYHLKTKKAFIKAGEDYKVDAKKIHLG